MGTPYFETYKSWGQYRFRIRAANGEPLASGEGYKDERDRDHAVNLLNPWGWPVREARR